MNFWAFVAVFGDFDELDEFCRFFADIFTM